MRVLGVFRDLHDQAFERHAKCCKTVDPGRIHQDLGAGVREQVGGVGQCIEHCERCRERLHLELLGQPCAPGIGEPEVGAASVTEACQRLCSDDPSGGQRDDGLQRDVEGRGGEYRADAPVRDRRFTREGCLARQRAPTAPDADRLVAVVEQHHGGTLRRAKSGLWPQFRWRSFMDMPMSGRSPHICGRIDLTNRRK
jgi:hypothetical protein